MNKRSVFLIGLIGWLWAGLPAAQADTTDSLLARIGEFQLDNGESRRVIGKSDVKQYRVCMTASPRAVPLRVIYDGKEALVAPGECHLIQARNLKLAGAERLDDDMTMIGRIARHNVKTDVSVARAPGKD